MSNFVAIDFETAIKHHICAVGIVTVVNGEIIEEYYSLIKPPNNEYNYYCTQVHGITSYDTVNSPSFAEIYPEIKKRLFFTKTVFAMLQIVDLHLTYAPGSGELLFQS